MGRHTPGPWKLRNGCTAIVATLRVTDTQSNDYIIAELVGRIPGTTIEVDYRANASLMAAAPDLLDALKGIMAGFDHEDCVRNRDHDFEDDWALHAANILPILAQAQAAIVKAEAT